MKRERSICFHAYICRYRCLSIDLYIYRYVYLSICNLQHEKRPYRDALREAMCLRSRETELANVSGTWAVAGTCDTGVCDKNTPCSRQLLGLLRSGRLGARFLGYISQYVYIYIYILTVINNNFMWALAVLSNGGSGSPAPDSMLWGLLFWGLGGFWGL